MMELFLPSIIQSKDFDLTVFIASPMLSDDDSCHTLQVFICNQSMSLPTHPLISLHYYYVFSAFDLVTPWLCVIF